ncbi:hypothetical protein EV662_101226 [Rhodovulum marinum]|uniref:Uncharacterized protein n=1 Tax=Rhodovulum marinum TaxID=320662 RepID=A0A4R2Q6K2_9RHOB|nr:hypothetical protein EV662_101226 [Rhodovulum marinum]
MLAQLSAGADRAVQQGHPLRAVYLVGGTPTALATRDLVRLIEGLRRHLPLAPDCEITLEGRIVSFGLEKARAKFDAHPGAALEDVASRGAGSVAHVLACLPEGEAVCVPGTAFEAVMAEIARWGEITLAPEVLA